MAEGFIVTILGMVFVFSFLTLLVVLMTTMSHIIVKYFPEKEEISQPKKVSSPEIEIAIALAVAKSKIG